MKRETGLLLALGGAVALWAWSRTQQGSQAIADTTEAAAGAGGDLIDYAGNLMSSTIRGIRDNNPGNLRPGTEPWVGQVGTEGGYLVFDTMAHGLRALAITLRNYWRFHQLDTVAGIIGRWAPPSDRNNTTAYIIAVANDIGVAPGDALDMENPATIAALTQAIIRHENGASVDDYVNDAMIDAASQVA